MTDHTCYLACETCTENLTLARSGKDIDPCEAYQAGEHAEWADCPVCQEPVSQDS